MGETIRNAGNGATKAEASKIANIGQARK